ncbi:MAG: hypothetical protein V4736_01145 [Bdellovibrionota bacterium]
MALKIEYAINFEDGTSKSFTVSIDTSNYTIPEDDKVEAPDWTLLEFNQCPHCPYTPAEKKYCPVAKNLSEASVTFKEARSFTNVTAFVKTEDRFYGKKTDLQTALFSLFGLLMATSACKYMDMFKSMAQFHLPFASHKETMVRTLGMHLLGEYMKQQDNPSHKISLDKLLKDYEQVVPVNQGMIDRIRALKGGDATQNAVIVLDAFASLLPLQVSSGLADIKELFPQDKK